MYSKLPKINALFNLDKELLNFDELGIPPEFRENYLFILYSCEFDSKWYWNTYLDDDFDIVLSMQSAVCTIIYYLTHIG